MIIKLKGPLPEELKDLGLKPGEKFFAYPPDAGRADTVKIRFIREHVGNVAHVAKENYTKIYE